jgi:hypothetical protein
VRAGGPAAARARGRRRFLGSCAHTSAVAALLVPDHGLLRYSLTPYVLWETAWPLVAAALLAAGAARWFRLAPPSIPPGDVLALLEPLGRHVGVAVVAADSQPALVISLTLVVICTLASVTGALLPMIGKKVGVDPVVVSAPLVTTLIDATGLIVYFLPARAILGV